MNVLHERAEQLGMGTWVCSLLLNTSVNGLLNSPAYSNFDAAKTAICMKGVQFLS